jgi:hypothetical protein
VGHTDHASSRVWIRVRDEPALYSLRVKGHGLFPFQSTEGKVREFGTALATADRLRPDWQYKYDVLRLGRVVSGAHGTFRTMPLPGSMADMLFVSLSCSTINIEEGAWKQLADYIANSKPRFLIMMGDQIYMEDSGNVWLTDQKSPPDKPDKRHERRQAMVELYQRAWSREPIRTILANNPTYMMCDDHEFRDGWGSWAPDSPTLAAKYPRGATIAAKYNTFFEDARDVYWHFQMCRNPLPPLSTAPPRGVRKALPFAFRCGRLAVLVLDGRGERDLWRTNNPVLGNDQWNFIDDFFKKLPAEVDALAVVTSHPIVTVSPNGLLHTLFNDEDTDVDLFKKGDAEGLLQVQGYTEKDYVKTGAKTVGLLGLTYFSGGLAAPLTVPLLKSTVGEAIGTENIADMRDRWSHPLCRPEQIRLIRAVGRARFTNRLSSLPRGAVFIGGDIHSGAIFEINVPDPDYSVQCLVASPIANEPEGQVGIKVDEDFEVGEGIRAKLRNFVTAYNFGVTHIVFGGGVPAINNIVAHSGDSSHWNIKLKTELWS